MAENLLKGNVHKVVRPRRREPGGPDLGDELVAITEDLQRLYKVQNGAGIVSRLMRRFHIIEL